MRRWHEETWPAIRAKAKKDDGEVLFADQVGIRSEGGDGLTACTTFRGGEWSLRRKDHSFRGYFS